MSITREMIADLRNRLGAANPLPARKPAPGRIAPAVQERTNFAQKAAQHTTALLGIGHAGTRYATRVVLQVQAELAVAHEAVETELPDDWAATNNLLPLHSRARNHREYLLRPDLGRRLDEPSLALLRKEAEKGVDIQPILADGLSAVACKGSGMELLSAFIRTCTSRGWRVGTPVGVKFARVWIEDEIGQEVQARVAAIMLGERPGLGTGDGLSAYLVHEPRVGKTDSNRNMMSNIHGRGTLPEEAAQHLADLAGAMLAQKTSGVKLDLSGFHEIANTGYRQPQVRVQLVETKE